MQTHHSQKEISNAAAAAASNVVGNNSSASSLEYLQLHGQMAAAAAGWQNLYATNKFYNPLHVDTINSMKHPNFLHGFYESLNKSHAQRYLDQSKKEFVSPTNTAQSKALMNLYNHRPSTMNGLYSPDRLGTSATGTGQAANNISSSASNSSSKTQQIYSPTTLLHRYGINPSAASTPNTVGGQPTAVEKSSSSCTKNSNSNYYSCGICERNDFSTENEVQTHRKIVHNLKTGVSLRCAYCSGDFRSR